MTKAPSRPVREPAQGGALPRQKNGQFAKRSPEAIVEAATPPGPDLAEPASASVARKARAATPAQLVSRVSRAIDHELMQLESILSDAKQTPARRTAADRHARMLAQLTRTLSDMTRLRAAASEKPNHADEAVPRDLDEFRRTLERRLAQLADQDAMGAAGGDEPG